MSFIFAFSVVGAVALHTCALGTELNAEELCQARDCAVSDGTNTHSFIQKQMSSSKIHVKDEEGKPKNHIESWQDEDGVVKVSDEEVAASRSETALALKNHTTLMEQREAEEADSGQPLTDEQWEKALGPEIEYHQLKQGELGDCYFLAALVAIARDHKDIIKNMFTDGSLLTGDHPVYTTNWLINGKKCVVAVDDKVPADASTGVFFFAHGKKMAFWPSVLEKAWAKIFGTYKKTEGGMPREVFKAITQAPVESVYHANILKKPEAKSKYWQNLLEWSKSRFPMSATTRSGKNKIGIADGHAFALLEAKEHAGNNPQRLKIFNPHSQNKYTGVLPNADKGDGHFYVTFDEFLHNFHIADVAMVQKGYVVSDISLSQESQSTTVLEFDMDTDEPFAVQLEWPSARLFGSKCQAPNPGYVVSVAKMGSLTNYKLMPAVARQMTNGRVDIAGGAGKYVVFVSVDFPVAKSWLKEFVVNVYGPQTKLVQSTKYTKPFDLFLEMQGLCKTVLVPGTGGLVGQDAGEYTMDESSKVNGMPIFVGNKKDKGKAVCNGCEVMYWNKYLVKWQIVGSIEKAKAGRYVPSFSGIPGAKCPTSLLQQPQLPEEDVLAEVHPEAASKEPFGFDELEEIGKDVVNLKGHCGRMVERLSSLGKGASIASSGTDGEFPENMQSIAAPGGDCGDSAQSIKEACEKYNHWQSLAAIKAKYVKGKTLEAQCVKDCSPKECVPKKMQKGSCLVDFSYCTTPLKYQKGHSWYTVPASNGLIFPKEVCTDDEWKVVPA